MRCVRETYAGPDSPASDGEVETCRDQAGNQRSASTDAQVRRDGSSGERDSRSRQPNAKGWFSASVTVEFTATDAMSGLGLVSCAAELRRAGHALGSDQRNVSRQGRERWARVLLVSSTTNRAGDDGAPSPPAEWAGWNKSPARHQLHGPIDATAGIDSCDGPEERTRAPTPKSVKLSGNCTR